MDVTDDLTESNATPPGVPVRPQKDMEAIATFLHNLLDDIDTASDMAKGDDKWYRKRVEYIVRKRWEVVTSDGYKLKFHLST